jgi:hypothetical protein
MPGLEFIPLWQSSLGKMIERDPDEQHREFFRQNLETFRSKAAILSAEISRSLPDYTVHDITHIDALWEMASLICGDEYKLNPAEAFVLGGAFLLHDLGMGLAAYPEGVSSLRNTVLWEDTFNYLSKKSTKKTDEIEKDTLEIVLRSLHARYAEKLAFVSWGDNDKEYLLDNQSLRDDYGAIIGKIAHSHWWDSSELSKQFESKLGAIGGMPNDWDVDPLKLACIMRVADASHIDSRRAPSFLKKIRNLNSYSASHWTFQQKLFQPRLERERLGYTSKSSFTIEEAASWWLCYDTLKMIDEELYAVDTILHSSGRQRFKAKGVAAVDNFDSISRIIKTEGWEPVDTRVHVGNISKLVKNLGGAQLYGENYFVPLRELIQNGCDAIRARRALEGEGDDYGKLIIRLSSDDTGKFIEVEDDGVGMSRRVLCGPFLDFGNSFWGSLLMHEELPGLESKGYQSTGKFGIGFFSVFMLGSRVQVTTRRFEEARQNTQVLNFENDIIDRPLLRNALEHEYIRNGGTRIRIYLDKEDVIDRLFTTINGPDVKNLGDLISHQFPASDVTVYIEDDLHSYKGKVIEANDWLSITGVDFIRRFLSVEKDLKDENANETMERLVHFSKNLCNIVNEDGSIVGRGFLAPENSHIRSQHFSRGAVTVGGMRTTDLHGVVGFLKGDTGKASRDLAMPIISKSAFKGWIKSQAELSAIDPLSRDGVILSSMLRSTDNNLQEISVGRSRNSYLNEEAIGEKYFSQFDEVLIVTSYRTSGIDNGLSNIVEYFENVLFVSSGMFSFVDSFMDPENYMWPLSTCDDVYEKYTALGQIMRVAGRVWGFDVTDDLYQKITEDSFKETKVLGKMNGCDYHGKVVCLKKSFFTALEEN